jgi:P27 family predicted phage terminase small subunit
MMKKSTATLIDGIREYLKTENLYKPKDEMTLTILGNTYEQYIAACAAVKKMGTVLEQLDFNENLQYKINPYVSVQLELQKQLFKLIDSLYLNPKARQSIKTAKPAKKSTTPFEKMMEKVG